MGFKFGKTSNERLNTCHEDIQLVMREAIKDSPLDFSIICGHRGEEEQNKAYAQGYSKVKYPNGKHNKYPSDAVDIAPYPNLFNADMDEWLLLKNHIEKTAKRLGINLRWGGDWNENGDYRDERFLDVPHWERRGS